MSNFILFFPLCLSQMFLYSPFFSFFFFFEFPKDEVCYSISFIFHFQKNSKFSFFSNPMDVCSYTCNFLGVWFTFFQTCILMCIMCLMQTLSNYAIQFQLHHYQLYTHQHVTRWLQQH